MISKLNSAVEYIAQKLQAKIDCAIILGSGLGSLEDKMVQKKEIPYRDIPFFPVSTVSGHAGKLILGKLDERIILAFSGRFHYDEGYSMQEIAFPIRVLKKLGVETLVLTNAVGGINQSYEVGDLMVISDHIKFFDESPLRGPNQEEFGPRFPDMSNIYTRNLRELVKETAYGLNIPMREGVYAFMPGPGYETPAEIRMLRTLGADVVGMSTVPEAITAAHCKMKVIGLSCVTNMAAGVLDQPLSHEEVIETGKLVQEKFSTLITVLLNRL